MDTNIKRAARTVIVDNDDKVAILDVRNGEYYKIPGGSIEEGEVDEEVFDFQPTVIGPKSTLADSVLFDTKNRRLYLVRPEEKYHGEDVHIYNDSFKATEFDKMKKKWFGDKK